MAAPKYSDVLKSARDLLEKSFKYEHKLEVKTSTKSGVTFTTEAVVSKPSSSLIRADAAYGKLKLDKLQVGSDKKVIVELSLAEALASTKLSFKAQDGSRGAAHAHHAAAAADQGKAASAKPKKVDTGIKAVIGVEHKQPFGIFTADIDAISYAVTLTGAVNYSGFLLGGQTKVGGLTDKVALEAYDVLLGYKGPDFTAALQTDSKLANVSAGFYQDVTPDVKFATIAHFPVPGTSAPPADSSKHEAPFSVDAALSYKLNPDTTVTAKVNHKGVIGLSYSQQVSPLAKLGFASEIHGAEISGDKHTFGVSLNITA